jgi:hypothetical protein
MAAYSKELKVSTQCLKMYLGGSQPVIQRIALVILQGCQIFLG